MRTSQQARALPVPGDVWDCAVVGARCWHSLLWKHPPMGREGNPLQVWRLELLTLFRELLPQEATYLGNYLEDPSVGRDLFAQHGMPTPL